MQSANARQLRAAGNASVDTVFVNTYAEGIEKVRKSKGKYAFLLEETTNEYENTRKPCNTMKVGHNLNTLGYGIATKIGSPLRGSINLAILYLQEKGELKGLENKWWYDRGQCDLGGSDSGDSRSLNLSKVAGIFYILSAGMALALCTAACEILFRQRKETTTKKKICRCEAPLHFSTTHFSKMGLMELFYKMIHHKSKHIPYYYNAEHPFDTFFEDREAFIFGISKYHEEATRHSQLNRYIEEGMAYASLLYTWRCMTRTAPTAQSNDQPNRVEMNTTIIEVMSPEIHKLYTFRAFALEAAARLAEEVKHLCHSEKKKDFVSETYLLTLARFMDMLFVLDELKKMKASIKNDVSTFKRATQCVQETFRELHDLIMFLADFNKIKDILIEEIIKVESYEDLMCDICNICIKKLETRQYVSPSEKYIYIRAILLAVYVIEAGRDPSRPLAQDLAKLDHKKRISIAKLDKVFRASPVIVLYGDCQVEPFGIIEKLPSYDAGKWPRSSKKALKSRNHISRRYRTFKAESTIFFRRFAILRNAFALGCREPTHAEKHKLTATATRGLQLLCSWTSAVQEFISWKLWYPIKAVDNPECPETAETYERATRYNYTNAEKEALIKIIALIKEMQGLLARQEPIFSEAVRSCVYNQIQELIQATLTEPLQKALKNKKDLLANVIQSIRDCCLDTISLRENSFNLSKDKKKSKSKTNLSCPSSEAYDTNRAVVPEPGTTQIYLLRTLLEALISDRSAGGKKSLRKDLDQATIDKIEHLLRKSANWSALLSFEDSLLKTCDFSSLWFREFYLEMANGARVQFPIEMSMPWILTDYILTSGNASLLDCALFQLGLYNDSAQCCLFTHGKQFLYDEVEAEFNLCFDQFIFKLSDAIYVHHKQLAACMILDKCFKAECQRAGVTIRTPPACRFDTILKQRHVQLLGRTVDLNRLISQRINIAFLKSLDTAICKFESEPLSSVIELDTLIQVNRMCHRMLSQSLHSLAPFDDLFLEANDNVLSSTPFGRISLHCLQEIKNDLLSNYYYNSTTHRFVKTDLPTPAPIRDKGPGVPGHLHWGSKSLAASFNNIFHSFSDFIGAPHLRAISRLVSFLKLSNEILNDTLVGLLERMRSFVPKVCKLPRKDYGSKAIFQYYLHHLMPVQKQAKLQKSIYHELARLGNMVAFALQIELANNHAETMELIAAAAFTMDIPKPPAKSVAEQNAMINRLEQKYERLRLTRNGERFASSLHGTNVEKNIAMATECETLSREKLCCGLSFFTTFLKELRNMLRASPQWNAVRSGHRVMDIDECVEWHRVFSALQFCQSLNQPEKKGNAVGRNVW
ncbi:unnamed protein product, partial [Mesorhabditis spiculigera]